MEAERFRKFRKGEPDMTKTFVAAAAAFAALSGAAFAGPIHTQTSVQEIVVVAYDKEPLTSHYAERLDRSLATMDIRLRTDIAKTSYASNEKSIAHALNAPSATALAFVGS